MIGVLETSTGPIAVLSGHARMPLRGIWTGFLELDLDVGIDVPIGPVDLVLAGESGFATATFRGTILKGDAISDEGRARCIVHGGAGQLATMPLSQRDYLKSPFDVSVGLIVRDAVLDAGEILATGVEESLAALRVPRWHRAGGCTGKEVLDRLAERFMLTWRLDDDGAVNVRLTEEYPPVAASIVEQLVRTGIDDGYSKMLELAPPSATIRPGQTVFDHQVSEVVYRLDGTGLRVELYYDIVQGGTASEFGNAVRAAMPSLLYREIHDATVRRQNSDGTLDLEADDAGVGVLSSVPYAPGIVGCRMVFVEGNRVRLTWQNGDESRPIVFAPDMLPKPLDLRSWGVAVARVGDIARVGSMSFVASPDANGGIGSISIIYTPQDGSSTFVGMLLPNGVPVTVQMGAQITTGSSEVYIRGDGI